MSDEHEEHEELQNIAEPVDDAEVAAAETVLGKMSLRSVYPPANPGDVHHRIRLEHKPSGISQEGRSEDVEVLRRWAMVRLAKKVARWLVEEQEREEKEKAGRGIRQGKL